jgi:hypothetical protein
MVAITFKVSPEEARAIRAAARASHKNVSAFIRSKVVPAPTRRRGRRLIKKHPVSGLPYDATEEGGRTVTLEEIKAALADFP